MELNQFNLMVSTIFWHGFTPILCEIIQFAQHIFQIDTTNEYRIGSMGLGLVFHVNLCECHENQPL